MKQIFVLLAVLCSVSAQERQDSARVFQAADVMITATRTTIPLADSPSPVEVMSRSLIQAANGSTVADALRNSTGLFLKDYGSASALKTISLRGTSAEQTLVLLNGVRLNSMQNGLVDLSMFPLSDVERIEVVRAGSSALYGMDALGGVVNILTRTARPGVRVRLEGSTGSFGFRRAFGEVEGRIGEIGLLAGAGEERGKDDFPFVVAGQSGNRTNADFVKRQAYVHGDAVVDEHSYARFSAQYVRADRGVPGSLSFPSAEARQTDDGVNLSATYGTFVGRGFEFSLKSGFHYNFQTYNDPNPFFPVNSVYRNTYFTANPQTSLNVTPEYRMILGGEFAVGKLSGNDFDAEVKRTQVAAYWSHEVQWVSDRSVFDRVVFFGTARYDDISDVERAFSPKIGVNIRAFQTGDVRLRGSIGKNFRSPTFNDLYYRGFSNPNLKPEISTAFDIGATAGGTLMGEHRLEIGYFNLDTKDRILFDPDAFLPVNIGHSVSQGVEMKHEFATSHDELFWLLSYTSGSTVKKNRDSGSDPGFDKQLVYVPRQMVKVIVLARMLPFTLGVSHQWTSERFTNSDNTSSLPAYAVTSPTILVDVRAWGVELFVKFEVNNIFDTSYEVFGDYPMPGRNYRMNVGLLR